VGKEEVYEVTFGTGEAAAINKESHVWMPRNSLGKAAAIVDVA
jgi:hypothetical protein